MADLLDRVSGRSETMVPPRPKIAVHQFMGGFRLYAAGAATAAELKQDFNLQGDELTQADQLITVLNGKTSTVNKLAYILKVEGVAFKLEDESDTIYHNPDGTLKKARIRTDLEI